MKRVRAREFLRIPSDEFENVTVHRRPSPGVALTSPRSTHQTGQKRVLRLCF